VCRERERERETERERGREREKREKRDEREKRERIERRETRERRERRETRERKREREREREKRDPTCIDPASSDSFSYDPVFLIPPLPLPLPLRVARGGLELAAFPGAAAFSFEVLLRNGSVEGGETRAVVAGTSQLCVLGCQHGCTGQCTMKLE
jgi:hypothetical protein